MLEGQKSKRRRGQLSAARNVWAVARGWTEGGYRLRLLTARSREPEELRGTEVGAEEGGEKR